MDYLVFPFTRGRIFNTIEKDTGQYNDSIKVFWTSGAAFITKKNIFNINNEEFRAVLVKVFGLLNSWAEIQFGSLSQGSSSRR